MTDIRLASPQALALALLGLLALTGPLRRGRKTKAPLRFSSTGLAASLPEPGSSRRLLPLLLKTAAILLSALALARPQRPDLRDTASAEVTDILLCLDVSESMGAEDFQPKNRLAVAKEVARSFVIGRARDRLGLVVFGRVAMTRCPLTTDLEAIIESLASVEIGAVPGNRTAVGDGLVTAVNRLKESAAKSKVVILLTDGSSNAGQIDPVTAARTAAGTGVRVYTIGVGDPNPIEEMVMDPLLGPRKVRIESDLDEETLERVASITGGRYFRATHPEALAEVFKRIDELEKTRIRVDQLSDYEELFRPLVLTALLLLFAERALALSLAKVLP